MEPKRQLTEEEAEQVAELEVGQELELADGVKIRMEAPGEDELLCESCETCVLYGNNACRYFDCVDHYPAFVEE